MARLARFLYGLASVLILICAIGFAPRLFETRQAMRQAAADPILAKVAQTQQKEPPRTPSALEDDPGAKPDAHDPASKISEIRTVFKSDSKYKFLKYEIWPGEYQKQKVWTIDYYYSERGLDGVFVLKHVACYFRRGKIIGNSEPLSIEEENAQKKLAEAGPEPPKDESDGLRGGHKTKKAIESALDNFFSGMSSDRAHIEWDAQSKTPQLSDHDAQSCWKFSVIYHFKDGKNRQTSDVFWRNGEVIYVDLFPGHGG